MASVLIAGGDEFEIKRMDCGHISIWYETETHMYKGTAPTMMAMFDGIYEQYLQRHGTEAGDLARRICLALEDYMHKHGGWRESADAAS